MPFLHYGSELRIELEASAVAETMEAIGAHATRGGWVTLTDVAGRQWSFLVSAGIPMWIDEHE